MTRLAGRAPESAAGLLCLAKKRRSLLLVNLALRQLSFAKMLSGLNPFRISNIQKRQPLPADGASGV